MAEEILGLLKKNYINLGLEKKDAMALQDGLTGYIKIAHYYCFGFFIYTIPIFNPIFYTNTENVTKSKKRVVWIA